MAGIITALRYQQRRSDRVNVFLDGRFVLALPAVAAASLRPGQELTGDDIARLKAIDEEQRAYERALRFLAPRPRSIAEIRRHLHKHTYSQALIETIIERLLESGYLDERAFARFWVSDRERFRPRGRLALRQELRQKGVSDTIIDHVLESVDGEQSAYRAGLARAHRLEGLEKPAFRRKLGGHLLRRGFTHDVVWPTVERLWVALHDKIGDSTDE